MKRHKLKTFHSTINYRLLIITSSSRRNYISLQEKYSQLFSQTSIVIVTKNISINVIIFRASQGILFCTEQGTTTTVAVCI